MPTFAEDQGTCAIYWQIKMINILHPTHAYFCCLSLVKNNSIVTRVKIESETREMNIYLTNLTISIVRVRIVILIVTIKQQVEATLKMLEA